ncbi:MAG: ATP-binding protein [Ruminococcus sp.]|nr:ATP-binding protein [Ruminococcus sp.]
MAKATLMCGKICSGKSTYAKELMKRRKAVILSVDEITLALFGGNAGEKHDEYVEKAENYLYEKSLEIIGVGIDVILDWGFWTKAERDGAREFYGSRGIEYEFYYINIGDDEWERRLMKRNGEVEKKLVNAYYVDEGLAEKFRGIFEEPEEEEKDITMLI